jgi:ABC-type transporter Mla maintaining outer membrane lipid asymmetry ATPase subunit MlaF
MAVPSGPSAPGIEVERSHRESGNGAVAHGLQHGPDVPNLAVLYAGKCIAFGSQKEIWSSQDPFIQQFLVGTAEGPLGMD